MIKIAICDDDVEFLKNFSDVLDKKLNKLDIDYISDVFSNGAEYIKSGKHFDLLFLDIDMPGISGFDMAERMYKSNDTLIVFVTLHDELVYSSLKFRPFRFIRKSFLAYEIEEVLKSAVDTINITAKEHKLYLSTKKGDIAICSNEIYYIEVYAHDLHIHTANDEIETYGSLITLEKELSEIWFVRVHKSYLVNIKYVYSIEQKQIIMDNKAIVPLSRYKSDLAHKKLREYIRSTT